MDFAWFSVIHLTPLLISPLTSSETSPSDVYHQKSNLINKISDGSRSISMYGDYTNKVRKNRTDKKQNKGRLKKRRSQKKRPKRKLKKKKCSQRKEERDTCSSSRRESATSGRKFCSRNVRRSLRTKTSSTKKKRKPKRRGDKRIKRKISSKSQEKSPKKKSSKIGRRKRKKKIKKKSSRGKLRSKGGSRRRKKKEGEIFKEVGRRPRSGVKRKRQPVSRKCKERTSM